MMVWKQGKNDANWGDNGADWGDDADQGNDGVHQGDDGTQQGNNDADWRDDGKDQGDDGAQQGNIDADWRDDDKDQGDDGADRGDEGAEHCLTTSCSALTQHSSFLLYQTHYKPVLNQEILRLIRAWNNFRGSLSDSFQCKKEVIQLSKLMITEDVIFLDCDF